MLGINQEWKFKDVVNNLETLKQQYDNILVSFSCFHLKDKVEFTRNVKDSFYSLKLTEFQKNLLWEYMNDANDLESISDFKERSKGF